MFLIPLPFLACQWRCSETEYHYQTQTVEQPGSVFVGLQLFELINTRLQGRLSKPLAMLWGPLFNDPSLFFAKIHAFKYILWWYSLSVWCSYHLTQMYTHTCAHIHTYIQRHIKIVTEIRNTLRPSSQWRFYVCVWFWWKGRDSRMAERIQQVVKKKAYLWAVNFVLDKKQLWYPWIFFSLVRNQWEIRLNLISGISELYCTFLDIVKTMDWLFTRLKFSEYVLALSSVPWN